MKGTLRLDSGTATPFALAAAIVFIAIGCQKKSEDKPSESQTSAPSAATAADKPFVAGFIYVGPTGDYGYNQAHPQGPPAVAKMTGVKIREEATVPKPAAVQRPME